MGLLDDGAGAAAAAGESNPGSGADPAAQSQISSDSNDNVRPEFLEAVKEYKREAGLTGSEEEEEEEIPAAEEKPGEVSEEKPGEESEDGEKKEAEEETDELKTPEGEPVKATRVKEVKEWGKGWQTTAETYKPAHDFLQEKFSGSIEEAEIAAGMFESILGTDIENFDPNKVFTELSELSRPRAEKLIEFFATQDSVLGMAEQRIVEKIFGKDLSPEELQEDLEGYKLFKQVGGLSALMDEDGELPAQLQYDADGNPRTEEEVNVFKAFLSELKGIKTERQKEAEEKAQRQKQETEAALSSAIESYTEERFENVKNTIKQVGLEIKPDDPENVKQQKTRDSRMINYYVVGRASEDDKFKSVYQEAVNALRQGDSITANRRKIELNRLVAGYTSEIVDDYITKNNIKIDRNQNQIDRAKEAKKEVNIMGGDITAKSGRVAGESIESTIDRLVKEGKLRSA